MVWRPTAPPKFFSYKFLDAIFGEDAFDNLFPEYGVGERDQEILQRLTGEEFDREDLEDGNFDHMHTGVSHKKLALARLGAQLAAVTAECAHD